MQVPRLLGEGGNSNDRRYWNVRVWWTEFVDPPMGIAPSRMNGNPSHWESSVHVGLEYASTAQEALACCLEWRKLRDKYLDGFMVELCGGLS